MAGGLRKILAGYLGIFKGLFALTAVVLGSILLGTIIVLPLWLFATTSPRWYSVFVGIVIASIIIFILGAQLMRAFRKYNNAALFFSRAFFPSLCRLASVLLGLLLLYGILLLYANTLYVAAAIASVAYLVLAGWFLFARSSRGRSDGSR